MSVGIVDMAFYVPNACITAVEIAKHSKIGVDEIYDKLGFNKVHVAGESEHCSDLAFQAVEKLFENSNIIRDSIDLLIYASNGINDLQFWSIASFVKKSCLLTNAFAFDLTNGCNAAATAILAAQGLLESNSEYQRALVVTSDVLSKLVNYENRNLFPFFSCGDGAAAIVLQKNYPVNRFLSHAFITDSDWNDIFHVKAGGTRHMKTALGIDDYYINFQYCNEEKIDLLRKKIVSHYVAVIRKTLQKANIAAADVKYFFFTQNSAGVLSRVISELDIHPYQTFMTAREFGHMGGVDNLFAFNLCKKQGKLKNGDLVLLASAGIGYNFGAHLVVI